MHKINTYTSNTFANILAKYNYNLHEGDIVAGTIIYEESKGFLVNIGDSFSGYLPKEEVSIKPMSNHMYNFFFINSTRDFLLIKQNSNMKQYILSIKRLEYIRSWKRVKQIQLEDIILDLKIQYLNKGGLITYIEGIQGFIPNSHIYLKSQYKKYYNNKIKCKILLINEQKNQLILSNKSALLHRSKHKFRLGELMYGIIVKIKPYGIFLELNKTIALLHISEIKSSYIRNINQYFQSGNLIKIKVIHIDIKQGRLSVSKKNLTPIVNLHQRL
uniref:Ribosomal protein S1 n=1 Tax=Nitophyllum punctatum TaxID=158729 RepID=A0A4D6WVB8_9FLOR|nr:ribosomal protein S1 [Nitophyllum punctatum]